MKNVKKIMSVGLTIAMMMGCSRSAKEKAEINYEAPVVGSESEDSNFISSSAAVPNKDTTRKFIRTANLRFRVNEVISATNKIEDIISYFDGFVTYTNLTSNIERRTVTPVSKDSALESTYYTTINEMIIRVPNTKLDTSLKAMAKLMDFLDYRIIKADDVTMTLMENKLTEKNLADHQQRLTTAIENRGKKLNETLNAEEGLLDKQAFATKTKIASTSIKDQISFSTINLSIYQHTAIKSALIENDNIIESYKPNFLNRIKESLITGWEVLQYIVVFLVKIWEIILLIFVVMLFYRTFYKKV